MGDIKKARKKYDTPRHPWQKSRIEEEKVLVREYGLKNKREIYKHNSYVKRIIDHYKKLNYQQTQQAQIEKEQLLQKAKRYGLVPKDASIQVLLSMTTKDLLERRLQTIVYKKKLARSVKQARQFITHRHITVDGRVVDAPGYIVSASEDATIAFVPRSTLFDEMHPERAAVKTKKEIAEEKKRIEKSKSKIVDPDLPEDLPQAEPTEVVVEVEEE